MLNWPVLTILILGCCLGFAGCALSDLFYHSDTEITWDCESATYQAGDNKLILIFNRTDILDRYDEFVEVTFHEDSNRSRIYDFIKTASVSNPEVSLTFNKFKMINDARYYIYFNVSNPNNVDLSNTWVSIKRSWLYMTGRVPWNPFTQYYYFEVRTLPNSLQIRIAN